MNFVELLVRIATPDLKVKIYIFLFFVNCWCTFKHNHLLSKLSLNVLTLQNALSYPYFFILFVGAIDIEFFFTSNIFLRFLTVWFFLFLT